MTAARVLYSPPRHDPSLLNETWLAQPALFAFEYALWRGCGCPGASNPIAPSGTALVSTWQRAWPVCFSQEDALRLIAARGRIMQKMPPGSMLAVPLSERDVRGLIDSRISVAAVNAPSLCTLSGADSDLAELHARLQAKRIESRLLLTRLTHSIRVRWTKRRSFSSNACEELSCTSRYCRLYRT